MQRNETTESDPTAAVTPPIRHTVPWRVISARALPNMRLHVRFVDGAEGEVDMAEFLADSRLDGTPFADLRDREMFDRVGLFLGAVQWPNGADLAPDAMYDEIRENGCWMLRF